MKKTKKKDILKSFIGLLIMTSSILIFLIIQKLEAKKEVVASYTKLPSLKLKDVNGKAIFLDKDYENEKIVLIVYSSECSFCLDEIKDIFKHIENFNATNILFSTLEDKSSIYKLISSYDTITVSNVKFSYSVDTETIQWMSNFEVPNIFIYNEAHELVKHFQGKTQALEISKYIQ